MKKLILILSPRTQAILLELEDTERGIIAKAIIDYHDSGTLPSLSSTDLQIVWAKVFADMLRQEEISKVRSQAGKKGAASSKGTFLPKQSAFCPNKTDFAQANDDLPEQNDVCPSKTADSPNILPKQSAFCPNKNKKTEYIYNINNNNNDNNINILNNNNKENNNKKEKVKKEKPLEERKQEFYDSLIPFVEEFGKVMVRDFFDYWTETNKSGKKMRFEDQRFFSLKRRLVTWRKNNEEKYNTNGSNKRNQQRSLDDRAAELVSAYLSGSNDVEALSDLH